MSIVCIAAIVGLSAMGIGYGYWTDSLNIGVSVTTGNINQAFLTQNGNGDLSLTLSEDGRTLYISGEVYPSFNDNIIVKVIDNGSIPSVFSGEIKESLVNEIADVIEQDHSGYSRYSLIDEDIIKTFEINISPGNDDTMMQGFYSINQIETFDIQDEVTDIQLEINSIEEEINSIQEEIDRLNIIEERQFIYELQFEQGI